MLLVTLVGVSAALRSWAGGAVPTPWIAPDELIYADLGRSLWHTGHLELFGQHTSYYSLLYPALAGLPLSLGDHQAGYNLLKALQAVVMSLPQSRCTSGDGSSCRAAGRSSRRRSRLRPRGSPTQG